MIVSRTAQFVLTEENGKYGDGLQRVDPADSSMGCRPAVFIACKHLVKFLRQLNGKSWLLTGEHQLYQREYFKKGVRASPASNYNNHVKQRSDKGGDQYSEKRTGREKEFP